MARIKIDRLALQVAGLAEAESRALAIQLADRMAQAPMVGGSRRIDALRVTVALSDDQRPEGLAERIADALLRQISREEG